MCSIPSISQKYVKKDRDRKIMSMIIEKELKRIYKLHEVKIIVVPKRTNVDENYNDESEMKIRLYKLYEENIIEQNQRTEDLK